jgi:hypothetical protein
MRIHFTGAAIHFTFTSLTLAYDLRRGEAADSIPSHGADVKQDDPPRRK